MTEQKLNTYCDPGIAVKKWIDKHVASSALCAPSNLYATASFTYKILSEGISGCLVECGVYKGAHPITMSYICQVTGVTREIWLFDSFEGITERGEEDDSPRIAHLRRGDFKCTIEEVRKNLVKCSIDVKAIRFVKGWFHETVPLTQVSAIALLRLDADLYESTKICMQHLYNKVVTGGFVVVDDWNYSGVQKAVRDVAGKIPQLQKVPGTECYFWRKERIIR